MKKAQQDGDTTSVQVARQLSDGLNKAKGPNSRFPHVVRMDFASGTSLETALKDKENFKATMTNPQFQKQLGRMMAGDSYTGNGDRFMSIRTGKNMPGEVAAPKLQGWFNPGNLIIEGSGSNIKLKAIDNDVKPGMNVTGESMFGNWSPYMQYGSVAATDPAQFKREIFAIAELMEKQSGVKLTPQELHDFVENTTKAAKEAMDEALSKSLTPDQLKSELIKNGETPERAKSLADSYAKHRQAMQMLSGGLKPEVSQRVQPSVRDIMKVADKGLSDKEAALELLNTPETKKAMEGMSKQEEERFKKLLAGERGDHVPKDFKLDVKEAALVAKDKSVYDQFTHRAPPKVQKVK